MKKGDMTKKVPPKLTLNFQPLKILMHQSGTTKAIPLVKAMLAQTPTPTNPIQISARQLIPITSRNPRAEVVTSMHTMAEKIKKITSKKESNDSTNELTQSVSTFKFNKITEKYFAKVIRLNLLMEYKRNFLASQLENVDKIIYNDKAHIVAKFKDYLIYDDIKEILQKEYKSIESMYLINKIACSKPKKFVPSDIVLKENKILNKANQKKEKIRKIREEDKYQHNENDETFFRTAFMNSLAKEDLSNSVSRLPSNSLEVSNFDEETCKFAELLKALDGSMLKKKKKSIQNNNKNTRNGNQIPIRNDSHSKRKKSVTAAKNHIPLNKQIALNNGDKKARPTTTMKKEQKPPSSPTPIPPKASHLNLNPYYFVSPRNNNQNLTKGKTELVKTQTNEQIKILISPKQSNFNKKKSHPCVQNDSLDQLSKEAILSLRKMSKCSPNSSKNSGLLKLLSDSKSGSRKDVNKSPPKENSKKNNYFAIYTKEKGRKSINQNAIVDKNGLLKAVNSSREMHNAAQTPHCLKFTAFSKKLNKIPVSTSTGKYTMKVSNEALLSKSSQVAQLAKTGYLTQRPDSSAKILSPKVEPKNKVRATPDIKKMQKCLTNRVKLP